MQTDSDRYEEEETSHERLSYQEGEEILVEETTRGGKERKGNEEDNK